MKEIQVNINILVSKLFVGFENLLKFIYTNIVNLNFKLWKKFSKTKAFIEAKMSYFFEKLLK